MMFRKMVVLLVFVVLLTAGFTQEVGAAPVERLGAADLTIDKGSNGLIEIILDSAPNGLSGFDITVQIPDILVVDSIEFPETFVLNQVLDGETSFPRLRAVDLGFSVQDGASDILLATLHVQGVEVGAGQITITVLALDDDAGNHLSSDLPPGTIIVNRVFPTFPLQSGPSQDLDDDGLVDDLNANDRMDFADLVLFFQHLDSPQVQENIDLFDYTSSDSVGMADVTGMFDHLIQEIP